MEAKARQACHRIGKAGEDLGPDLNGVIAHLGRDGVMKKLENPRYNHPASAMPPMGLSPEGRAAVAAYLSTLTN